MREIRRFFSRLIAFFRANQADSDLTREIDAHLQLLQDQFIAKGMTPEEAGYSAASTRQRNSSAIRGRFDGLPDGRWI